MTETTITKTMTKNEFCTKFVRENKGDWTEAAKAWNESPYKKARGKAGSPKAFLDYLVEAPRSREDAETWLNEEGSENMRRAANHYLAIADAISQVRESQELASQKAA